jgi:hypothetical protein
MSDKKETSGHWPFQQGAGGDEQAAKFRAALERKNARAVARATQREHLRNDRLIVGGRAHAKKHGVS